MSTHELNVDNVTLIVYLVLNDGNVYTILVFHFRVFTFMYMQ